MEYHYKIVKELSVKIKSSHREKMYHMTGPHVIWHFLKEKIGDSAEENFVTLHLDRKNHIVSWCIISRGTVSDAIVHPREVFKCAIITNTSKIIIAHNHPSGDLTPSREDLATTLRLKEVATIIGIPLLDHIIVSDTSFLSMTEEGYI